MDGSTPRTPGATASVVQLRETGFTSARRAFDPAARHEPDPMPVFQIVTPRAGAVPPDAFSARRRYPRRFSGDTHAQKSFDAAIARLDRYNNDLTASEIYQTIGNECGHLAK